MKKNSSLQTNYDYESIKSLQYEDIFTFIIACAPHCSKCSKSLGRM